jgi:hypothetical protein
MEIDSELVCSYCNQPDHQYTTRHACPNNNRMDGNSIPVCQACNLPGHQLKSLKAYRLNLKYAGDLAITQKIYDFLIHSFLCDKLVFILNVPMS